MRYRFQVIVCVRGVGTRRWISEELADGPGVIVVGAVCDAVEMLMRGKREYVLVVDVEELSAEETIELQEVRSRGWSGVFIALGHAPEHLKARLELDYVLPRPLGSETLRATIGGLDATADTAEVTLVD